MMDDETREALELTKDELLRMKAESKPARVARKMPRRIRRKKDLNQRAAAIVSEATALGEGGAIEIPWDPSTVIVQEVRFQEDGPVSVKSGTLIARK